MKKAKKILIALLILAVVGACAGGYWYFTVSANTLKTDNARVTAKMYTVTGTSSSKIREWNVSVGDPVSKDQVLGRQETTPDITSPVDGTIVKSDAYVDQLASPSTQLAVVADSANPYIGVNIEETEFRKIALGQRVDVKIDAYPGRMFAGEITEIGPATQTYFTQGLTSFSTSGEYTKVKQLIPVKVFIENPENLPLIYGMNCEVAIHLK